MRKRRYYRPYGGRRRNPWLTAICALAALALAGFLILEAVVLYHSRDQIRGEPAVLLVLGCQVRTDGPSVLLQDRLDKALAYWREHPETTVVVSGGQGENEPTTEAAAMAGYLMAGGVPETSILLEEASHNTNQNLRFSVALLEREGYELSRGVAVVSNGFHLARVRMLWGRICGGTEHLSTLAAPSSHFTAGVYSSLREVPGLVKSFVLDR